MNCKWFRPKYFVIGLGIGFVLGCAGSYFPPMSVTAGFFGAQVTVAEPGFTVPAKVTPTNGVMQPTLLVPASEPIAVNSTVPVTTANGATTTVPIKIAPVPVPVLAIPATGSTPL
jgi:hypothetical protein